MWKVSKYGAEKLRIWTLFMQCISQIWDYVLSIVSWKIIFQKLRSIWIIWEISHNVFFIFFIFIYSFFFSIWVFFHERAPFIGQQGKGKGIYLTPLYHFHPLHRHLDITRKITAESSPLHIARSRTRTGNLWFPSASR